MCTLRKGWDSQGLYGTGWTEAEAGASCAAVVLARLLGLHKFGSNKYLMQSNSILDAIRPVLGG
ncbi:MAG: hypothetical protein FRX49_00471 [Trebouxia sp. A1-2]|nr:MAG: hypothetical protein FRX49_00471 [Trebouxia sp. A1-2]